jgi:hypothetical protein
MGEMVLTTCNPDKSKKRSVDDVVKMLLNGQSICLVFGAGPKGVPKDIHDMARNHMDITFGEYSLETCTAMGACVAVLAHKVHQARDSTRHNP